MKVLLVHKFFHITGGAEVFLMETARVLKENGHEVAFFSTKNKLNKKTKYERYFVEAPKFNVLNIGEIIYSKRTKKKFAEILDDFKPDVVHAFGIFTHLSPSILEAAKERGIPVVMSCNDYKHICPNYKLFHHGKLCEKCRGGKFYQAILNKCCHESVAYSTASAIEAYVHEVTGMVRKNVDMFLFASDFMARKTEEFWGKDTFKWKKILNPIKITPIAKKTGGDNYILFFGRLIEEKGVKKLVTAMRKITEIKLIVVGDGPEKGEIEKIKRDNSLNNVELVGEKWGPEMDELVNNCRLVVVPSRWHENFPYVIIQAFMAGKPVVATNRGGIPELVNKERGILYDDDKEGSLETAIKHLWNRPKLVKKMGEKARKYIEETFSDEKFYKDTIEAYKKVIN